MTTPQPPQTARFLDIHVLLAAPYANLNRDDTGTPKTCHIGGVERARVSSQCQKRAARLAMSAEGAARTRKLPAGIAKALTAADPAWGANSAAVAAAALLVVHGFEPYKNNIAETSILTFLPTGTPARIAEAATSHAPWLRVVVDTIVAAASDDTETAVKALARVLAGNTKKDKGDAKPLAALVGVAAEALTDHDAERDALNAAVKDLLGDVNPVIALFGRMLTAMPDTNVDGAAQVAHAFSTHVADIDTDYFTAVDDLNPVAEPGAGMIGTPDYVSAVYYRRAVVDLVELAERLKDRPAGTAQSIAAAFTHAFATSISDAKRTSCGPPPRPSVVLVVARDDTPVSYANAFEKPVAALPGGGYLIPSTEQMLKEAGHDRGDPGIVAGWMHIAPSVAEEMSELIDGLFDHTPVTLHTLEAAVREELTA